MNSLQQKLDQLRLSAMSRQREAALATVSTNNLSVTATLEGGVGGDQDAGPGYGS